VVEFEFEEVVDRLSGPDEGLPRTSKLNPRADRERSGRAPVMCMAIEV
jgi:hypothetical protein